MNYKQLVPYKPSSRLEFSVVRRQLTKKSGRYRLSLNVQIDTSEEFKKVFKRILSRICSNKRWILLIFRIIEIENYEMSTNIN